MGAPPTTMPWRREHTTPYTGVGTQGKLAGSTHHRAGRRLPARTGGTQGAGSGRVLCAEPFVCVNKVSE